MILLKLMDETIWATIQKFIDVKSNLYWSKLYNMTSILKIKNIKLKVEFKWESNSYLLS